jgi:hypothetical protein
MDDRIGRLVASDGVDRTAADKAVGTIVRFLLKVGPTDTVRALRPSSLHAKHLGKRQPAKTSARFPASTSSSDAH